MIIKKVFTIYKTLSPLTTFPAETNFRLLCCEFVPLKGYESRITCAKGIVFSAAVISCLDSGKGIWSISVNVAGNSQLVTSEFFYLQYLSGSTWTDVDGMSPFHLKVTPWMQTVNIGSAYGFSENLSGESPIISAEEIEGLYVQLKFAAQLSGTTFVPSYSIKKVEYSLIREDEVQFKGSRESVDNFIDIPLRKGIKAITYSATVINPKNGSVSLPRKGEITLEKNAIDMLYSVGTILPVISLPVSDEAVSHYTSEEGVSYISLTLPTGFANATGIKYSYEVAYAFCVKGETPSSTLTSLASGSDKQTSITNSVLIRKPHNLSGQDFNMSIIYRIFNPYTTSNWFGSTASSPKVFMDIKHNEWQVPDKLQMASLEVKKKSASVYPASWDSEVSFSKTFAKTLSKITYIEDYVIRLSWGYPTKTATGEDLTDKISKVLVKAYYLSRALTEEEKTAVESGENHIYSCIGSAANAIIREVQFYVERLPQRSVTASGTTYDSVDSNNAYVDAKWNDRIILSVAPITTKGISGLVFSRYIDVQSTEISGKPIATAFKEAIMESTLSVDNVISGKGLTSASVSIRELHGLGRGSEVVTVVGGTNFGGRATWNLTYKFGSGQERTITSNHGSFTISKPLSSDSSVWSEIDKTCSLSLTLWMTSSESLEETAKISASHTVSANYLPVSEIIAGLASNDAMVAAVAVKLGQLYSYSHNSETQTPTE